MSNFAWEDIFSLQLKVKQVSKVHTQLTQKQNIFKGFGSIQYLARWLKYAHNVYKCFNLHIEQEKLWVRIVTTLLEETGVWSAIPFLFFNFNIPAVLVTSHHVPRTHCKGMFKCRHHIPNTRQKLTQIQARGAILACPDSQKYCLKVSTQLICLILSHNCTEKNISVHSSSLLSYIVQQPVEAEMTEVPNTVMCSSYMVHNIPW